MAREHASFATKRNARAAHFSTSMGRDASRPRNTRGITLQTFLFADFGAATA
jgi:hypothetical protein